MKYSLAALLTLTLLFSGCKKTWDDSNWTYQLSKTRHSLIATMQTMTEAQRRNELELSQSILQFDAFTNEGVLATLKNAWRASWRSFLHYKPFYYMESAVVNSNTFDVSIVNGGKINTDYIDATVNDPSSGIIVNTTTYPEILFTSMDDWNMAGDPENRTLGYQVMEFLLWGEDLSPNLPGLRPATDFNQGGVVETRRLTFLRYVGTYMHNEFDDFYFPDKLENDLLTASNRDFLDFVLNGLIRYIEDDFAERGINIPYLSQDIDDEISRFSDNTRIDLVSMLEAIKVVLYGEGVFDSSNNYFLGDLIHEVNPKAAISILNSVGTIEQRISEIFMPFDQAISSSTERPKLYDIRVNLLNISAQLKEFSKSIN